MSSSARSLTRWTWSYLDVHIKTSFILAVACLAGLRHGSGFTSKFPDTVGVQFVDARRIQAALLFGADMCIKRVVNRRTRFPSTHQRTMITHLLLAILISGDIQLNPGLLKFHVPRARRLL